MANEIKALTIDGTRRTIKDETARNAAQQAQTTANSKQDELTFDTAPTSGSNNPVTSGGVYTAMQSFAPELPIASTETLGGVKVDGTTITADENGVISGASTYVLPTASTTQLGGVKVDGDTVNIDANGVISTSPSAQADWDETDSTDPAYIVNKPFGYVAGDVTIIEQASYGGSSVTYEGTINSTRYAAVDEVTATEDITNNTEYKITVDGTAYTVTSRNVNSTFANSDDTRLLNIIGYGIVTPYCAIVRSTYEQSLGSIFMLLATNGQWTTVPSRTVKLEKDGEVILKIDPDFIPIDGTTVKLDANDKLSVDIEDAGAIPASEKGSAGGVAELDENGIILSSELPVMSPSSKGGAKLGSGLSVDGEALNLGPLTASGNGASVETDGSGIFGVTGEGFAHQDGTPTPDSPQEIRVARGRNLLDPSKAVSKSGGDTVSGNIADGITISASSATTTARISGMPVEVGKTYVISFDAVATAATTAVLVDIGDQNASGTAIGSTTVLVGATKARYSVPITHGSITNYKHLDFALTTLGRSVTITNIQLELGTTPTPYVPYGCVGLEVQGRNLLPNNATSQTINGVTFTKHDDGSISASGTSSAGTSLVICSSFTLPVGAYKISGFGKTDSSDIYGTLRKASDNSWIANIGDSGYTLNVTNANFAYRVVAIVISGKTPTNTIYPQIEAGTEATEYVPYSPHTTTPIPLPAKGFAAALPDGTADALTLDSAGRWEWTGETAQYVFDGDESWNKTSATTLDIFTYNFVASGIVMSRYYYNIFSSHFVGGSVADANRIMTDNGYINITFASGTFSDASGYKTWLTTHPVTVLYPLATPTTEHGYINLPELPAGATVSIPELEAVGVEWWVKGAEAIAEHGRDVSKANKEQEDRIAELEAAVANLTTD